MNELPAGLRERINQELTQLGDPTGIQQTRPVSGGCIHQALCLETKDRRYFLKWNAKPVAGMFTTEASELQLLEVVGAVRVPKVLSFSEVQPGFPSFLLEEWIEPAPGEHVDFQQLGRGLAFQHQLGTSDTYGLDYDNFIGLSPQTNRKEESWVRFWGQQRLATQMELARKKGHLTVERSRRLERIILTLDRWIDDSRVIPSLLHGDLWGGNVLAGPAGQPVLIDPAVYYGDREAELAFTELFGGFSPAFYSAYKETWPLDPGYPERRDLYNLYHLLNHLNLFGESYGYAVDSILMRYS